MVACSRGDDLLKLFPGVVLRDFISVMEPSFMPGVAVCAVLEGNAGLWSSSTGIRSLLSLLDDSGVVS